MALHIHPRLHRRTHGTCQTDYRHGQHEARDNVHTHPPRRQRGSRADSSPRKLVVPSRYFRLLRGCAGGRMHGSRETDRPALRPSVPRLRVRVARCGAAWLLGRLGCGPVTASRTVAGPLARGRTLNGHVHKCTRTRSKRARRHTFAHTCTRAHTRTHSAHARTQSAGKVKRQLDVAGVRARPHARPHGRMRARAHTITHMSAHTQTYTHTAQARTHTLTSARARQAR